MTTPRAETAQELIYQRRDGQRSLLYLAIRKPTTIYTATLDSAPETNDMVTEISFTGGSGTLGDVLADMTLLVGSAAGKRDMGICRIRKAPIAGTFYIGETSDIEWDAGGTIYLTVTDDYGLWAKHIKLDGSTPYMDVDVAYSDQHDDFDPITRMGNDAVLWRTGASVTLAKSAAGSSVFGSTISSYLWTCAGANVTGGNTATPSIEFTSDGQYLLYCTVTAANGKSWKGVRVVYVFSDDNPPEVVFNLGGGYVLDYDDGGATFDVEMPANATLDDIDDMTKVVLFARDWYGDTEISIGQELGNENILATGWIQGETIEWNYEIGVVTFSVAGAHEWMRKLNAFTQGLELDQSPDAWTDMPNLTVDRAVWHLLHWRSTATRIMDVNLTGDTRIAEELVGAAGSLWSQIEEMAAQTILARTGVDQYGAFHCVVEPQLVPEASRAAFPTIREILEQDWHDVIEIERKIVSEVSQVDFSGVAIGSNGSSVSAYLSLSPGHIFKQHGDPTTVDKLLLSSQSQANQLCGLVSGWKNDEHYFEIKMACNHRMCTLWPAQYYSIALTEDNNPRGVEYSGRLVPRAIEYEYDYESGELLSALLLEAETFEDLSITNVIPVSDDDSFPPLPPLPDLPDLPDPVLPPIVDDEIEPKTVAVWIVGKGFWYTDNFDDEDDATVWYSWNAGLNATKITNDDYWGFEVSRISGRGWLFDTDYNLLTSPAPGQPWVVVHDQDWLINQIGLGAASHKPTIGLIGINRGVSDQVFMIAGNGFSIYTGKTASFVGSSSGLTKVWEISSGGHSYAVWEDQWGMAVYGYGEWLALWKASTQKILVRYTAAGGLGTKYNVGNIAADMGYLARGGLGGQAGAIWNTDPNFRKVDANGATLTTISSLTPYYSVYKPYLSVAVDPSGLLMVGFRSSTSSPNLRTSSDGGVTWSAPALWSGVGRSAENCGDSVRWIIQAANGIYYSGDFFTTWKNKTGDLNTKCNKPTDMRAFIIRYIW